MLDGDVGLDAFGDENDAASSLIGSRSPLGELC